MARVAETLEYITPFDAGALSAEVRAEVEKIRMDNHPWTLIRPLQKGADASDALTCDGATGDRTDLCSSKVEAVQYNVQGESQHYCEKHAVMQAEWDTIHYRSKARPVPDLTKEQIASIAKLLEKKKSKKEREKEAMKKAEEENDLMA